MHAREGLSADATLRKALNHAEAFMTLRFKLPPCRLMRSARRCRNLSRVAFHGLTKRPGHSVIVVAPIARVPAFDAGLRAEFADEEGHAPSKEQMGNGIKGRTLELSPWRFPRGNQCSSVGLTTWVPARDPMLS